MYTVCDAHHVCTYIEGNTHCIPIGLWKNSTKNHKEVPEASPVSDCNLSDELMSQHDSSDESIDLGKYTFGFGITHDEPKVDSWDGVRLEKATSSKSRQRTSYEKGKGFQTGWRRIWSIVSQGKKQWLLHYARSKRTVISSPPTWTCGLGISISWAQKSGKWVCFHLQWNHS